MSGRKRQSLPAIDEIHENIQAILSTTKPKLDDASTAVRASLIVDLHQVASLAELFTEQRPRNKNWAQFADNLDREGVNLWNISGLVRRTPEDDGRVLVAALRFAGFRLVEAGLEAKPAVETLLHVLQLASKAGATLSEAGNNDAASSVLTSAAKEGSFEDALRKADDPGDTHRQAKACATTVYFSSRMEAAWKEGKLGMAEFMRDKIMDQDPQRFALLPPRVRELLASKLHDIGKSILADSRSPVINGPTAAGSVQWLQKAFTIIEQLDGLITPGVAELKIAILRTLARAYFLSSSDDPENLSRAEAALQALLPSIDASTDHDKLEYQELRWQRLAVLKRGTNQPGDSVLLDAFTSIIDHMSFSDTSVTDLLQELRMYPHQHALVTAVNQQCLLRALGCREGSDFVDRLLLSLVFHCSKDEDHARAMRDLNTAFQHIHDAEYELLPVPTTACLTLIWQYGGRYHLAKKWSEAADWYLAGSHQIFHATSPTSRSKCFRKAALCHIEQREYATASAVIRRCPMHEAATHYIILLVAVHQGLEDEAIRAAADMVNAPDFDRKMLLLATRLSHGSEMKTLLLSVLEMLLRTLKPGNSGETVVESMTLVRCIIRLVLKLLGEPGANQPVLIDMLVERFLTAKALVDAASVQNALSMIMKDVSWLWRTAYNAAVRGCAEWENCENRISELFEMSRDLLETYCQASPVDVDGELYMHLVNASFSAVSGRVFAVRHAAVVPGESIDARLRDIAAAVEDCQNRINTVVRQNKITEPHDVIRVQSFLHLLCVFEAEFLSQLKEWDRLTKVVEVASRSDTMAVATLEAIADILWTEKDCPVDILYKSLEAILHASLDRNALSVDKFARWLRAICTIILSKNVPADRTTAIGYVEQALVVMQEHAKGDEAYPMDERQWLLATAYNTATECVHASLLDEAKRWFECSTVVCKFVPDGKGRSERISEAYMHLLARYTRT